MNKHKLSSNNYSYKKPKIEIFRFDYSDIIATSACSGDCSCHGTDTHCPDAPHLTGM